jgi:DNA-binding GntR family transcriptional regulator
MADEAKGNGTRASAVYRSLRRAIIEQALRPGAKLPEDAIGERLGVSRTLAREALVRLAGEGLVELRPNRGAFVAYPTLEEGRDVFMVRNGLEQLVIQALVGRLAPDQVSRLKAHVAAEEKAAAKGSERESIRLAGEFHTLLAEMTGNALLIRYVNETVSRCSLILALYGRPHSSECAVSEHREVIQALLAGDERRALELMDHHLGAVMNRALLGRPAEPDLRDVLAAYGREEGL